MFRCTDAESMRGQASGSPFDIKPLTEAPMQRRFRDPARHGHAQWLESAESDFWRALGATVTVDARPRLCEVFLRWTEMRILGIGVLIFATCLALPPALVQAQA